MPVYISHKLHQVYQWNVQKLRQDSKVGCSHPNQIRQILPSRVHAAIARQGSKETEDANSDDEPSRHHDD